MSQVAACAAAHRLQRRQVWARSYGAPPLPKNSDTGAGTRNPAAAAGPLTFAFFSLRSKFALRRRRRPVCIQHDGVHSAAGRLKRLLRLRARESHPHAPKLILMGCVPRVASAERALCAGAATGQAASGAGMHRLRCASVPMFTRLPPPAWHALMSAGLPAGDHHHVHHAASAQPAAPSIAPPAPLAGRRLAVLLGAASLAALAAPGEAAAAAAGTGPASTRAPRRSRPCLRPSARAAPCTQPVRMGRRRARRPGRAAVPRVPGHGRDAVRHVRRHRQVARAEPQARQGHVRVRGVPQLLRPRRARVRRLLRHGPAQRARPAAPPRGDRDRPEDAARGAAAGCAAPACRRSCSARLLLTKRAPAEPLRCWAAQGMCRTSCAPRLPKRRARPRRAFI